MLHLFNKVYLEFDTNIEINFDRIVISEQFGTPMYQALENVSYGKLLKYAKSFDEVESGFIGLIEFAKAVGDSTDKKVIIYCDRTAYKRFVTKWFKLVLPEMSLDSFKTLMNYTIYNQRIISNTQLSSVYSMNLTELWNDVSDITEYWSSAPKPVQAELDAVRNLNLKYSYELLLSTYLSGDAHLEEELKTTVHTFIRRWWKEILSDNRQMVLLNLTNHRFQTTFGIDPKSVDLTKLDPLEGIVGFEVYSDDEIWERDENQYGVCKLEGLSQEKADALMTLLKKVYGEFEGMQLDRSVFALDKYIGCACRDKLTDEEVTELINLVVNNPFDTCLVPRFDFQNVNFPLMQYFLAQKFNGEDLSEYRLL